MEPQSAIIRSEMAELNLLKSEMREKETQVAEMMNRLSQFASGSPRSNPADAYHCRPQTIECESGKTVRITFELTKSN